MSDIFLECLVKRKTTIKSLALILLYFFGAIVLSLLMGLFVLLFFLQGIIMFPLATAGAIFGAVILSRRQNVEFEYIVSGWSISIDKIISKRSRKRLFKLDVRKIELMAPVSEKFKAEMDNTDTYIDASSSPYAEGLWFFVFKDREGVRFLFVFEPNERILTFLRKKIQGKIKE